MYAQHQQAKRPQRILEDVTEHYYMHVIRALLFLLSCWSFSDRRRRQLSKPACDTAAEQIPSLPTSSLPHLSLIPLHTGLESIWRLAAGCCCAQKNKVLPFCCTVCTHFLYMATKSGFSHNSVAWITFWHNPNGIEAETAGEKSLESYPSHLNSNAFLAKKA